MALQDVLIKINLYDLDTKGLYYKDTNNLFSKKELHKSDLKKFDYEHINLVLKFYLRNKQIKKTLKFNNMTGLQAIKKAVIIRSELRNELEVNGAFKKKTYQLLNDLFLDYIESKSQKLSERNIYTTTTTYNKWIQKSIGRYNIKDITTQDMQKIINIMLKAGKKPRTAQSIKQILRPLFNYAIDLHIVHANPAIKIEIPSFDNTVNFELSNEQRTKLYEEILKYEPIKYRGIMLFLYFGRRLNEVLTLKWSNININQLVYTIEDQYSKIRRRQEYPLLEPLKDFLQLYDKDNIKSLGYVFPGEKTKHVTKNTFRNHWKKLLKNAEIDKMRIHDTRHLLGNTLVNRGESLENIGKVLGHSSVAVTRRYAKTTLETADRLLNEYLK